MVFNYFSNMKEKSATRVGKTKFFTCLRKWLTRENLQGEYQIVQYVQDLFWLYLRKGISLGNYFA